MEDTLEETTSAGADLYNNNWQLFSPKKADSTNLMIKHVNYKH